MLTISKEKGLHWRGLEYTSLGQLIVGAVLQIYLVSHTLDLPWSYFLAGALLTLGAFGTMLGRGMDKKLGFTFTIILAISASAVICAACIASYFL